MAEFENGLGQVTLPVILVISGVIIEIAIAFGFIAYFFSTSGLGERLSVRAESAAISGVRDALVKISRNRDFSLNPCDPPPSASTLIINGDAAEISVCRTLQGNQYIFSISSKGMAGTRQKKYQATAIVDQLTGVLRLQSMAEIPAS